MSTTAEPLVVDALGLACPVPVINLAKAITEVEVGTEVVVIADDPGAKVDIPVWCRMKRQELVAAHEEEPGRFRFRVRRIV
jgi:TusA-related sulfurtransferase